VAAAGQVFAERGVSQATVADIVARAGVAQGTFYLYFASKDEVVLAVAEQLVERLADTAERLVLGCPGDAVHKLRDLGMLLASFEQTPETSDLVELLHRPENRSLHDRLTEGIAPRLASLVASIVQMGVDEGVFQVPDARGAAWFVLGGLRSVELAGTPVSDMPAALAGATELALRALGWREPSSSPA
jgi:AcrR family transcriptional regulator